MNSEPIHRDTLRLAEQAAAAGATVLARCWGQRQTALAETDHDIKLQADRDAEAAILDELAESPWACLAEESGERGACGVGGEPYWVVDPLDGTLNFSRGIPFCCVSVALCRGDQPVLGVVHDFIHQEVFTGVPGMGAWQNGAPMRVSQAATSRRALLGMGYPLGFEYDEAGALELHARQRRFGKVRQMGSAALLLAWVACGRLDAYLEDDIMFWDIAAGAALVEAAGGWVSLESSSTGPWSRKIRAAARPSVWKRG